MNNRTPEENLIINVVLRALRDIVTPAKGLVSQKDRQEARDFFYCDSLKPFSFIWCSEVLYDDAEGFRQSCLNVIENNDGWKDKFIAGLKDTRNKKRRKKDKRSIARDKVVALYGT